MATWTYDEALKRLLVHEGGYTNHPSDPGGPTNFGITIHDYRKYVKPDAAAADVRAMRVEEAKAIYKTHYWNAQRCDELPAGVDYAVFDYGVNSGIGRSKKVLQRVVGVADDGILDQATLAAAAARDARVVVIAVCEERLAFLRRLKNWPVFGKGWGRRVAEVKAAALAMADARPGTAQQWRSGAGAVLASKRAQKAGAVAIVAAGAAAAQQGHGMGAEFSLIGIVVAGIGLAAASWLAWRWWQQRRTDDRLSPKERTHELE
jgi:lysozyme family protein